eukprot:23160-Hanusia_phi.AAC.1
MLAVVVAAVAGMARRRWREAVLQVLLFLPRIVCRREELSHMPRPVQLGLDRPCLLVSPGLHADIEFPLLRRASFKSLPTEIQFLLQVVDLICILAQCEPYVIYAYAHVVLVVRDNYDGT